MLNLISNRVLLLCVLQTYVIKEVVKEDRAIRYVILGNA